MRLSDLKGRAVAFAASGGLDSCTITRWLADHGVRVICFTADLAQPDESDFDEIKNRMLACGAAEFVGLPLREAIAEAGLEVVQAQAAYEGRYWNTTGVGRHVIVKGIVAEMKRRGIEVMSHGATGRGNDQVRFQVAANMLDPSIKVYAPWRDDSFLSTFRGRNEMIDFCIDRGLPIKANKQTPYSTDANLLGLTHEAGLLESLATPASVVKPGMGVLPQQAPDEAEPFSIVFRSGRPVEINGRAMTLFDAFSTSNLIGGRHGVGVCYHLVENRFVGIKSRGVYEAPGMELLAACYAFVLQLVLDRRAREVYDYLSQILARQLYQGYGFDLASRIVRKAIRPITALVSGRVTVSLYKGNVTFHSLTEAPHSLYSEVTSSMEAVGDFNHEDSEGLLRVLSVSARALAAAGQVE